MSTLVQEQFGRNAAGYLTSKPHAQGKSLDRLIALTKPQRDWRVLDVATGGGHVAYAFAPHVARVWATDITDEMIALVRGEAAKKGLANIRTAYVKAEALSFDDASFDLVTCRIAPHHFDSIPAFVAEAHRVLKPGGRLKFIDIAGIDDPLYDTHIQAIELLRDASHIRDYRADEWIAMLDAAGFDAKVSERWRIALDFDSWVARMRTPPERVTAIRSMWERAPDEVRQYFDVQSDLSFKLDALMIEATRRD